VTVTFRRKAKCDVVEAFEFYEAKRRGLGSKFVQRVDEMVNMIAGFPMAYAEIHDDIRRAYLKDFPYSVFYKHSGKNIVVFAACISRDIRQLGRNIV